MSLEILPPLYEGRVLHVRASTSVDAAVLETFFTYVRASLAATPHSKLHFLIDVTYIQDVPNLPTVVQLAKNLDFVGSNEGWYVLYGGENRVLGILMNVLRTALKFNMKSAHSYEDALVFLTEADPDVARLSA